MTLKIISWVSANERRFVKAIAIIPKSKKNGVPRRFQKTLKVRTVAPEFSAIEMEKSFLAECERWEARIMAQIASEKEAKVEVVRESNLI